MSTKDQRKRFRAYHEEHTMRFQAWVEAGYPRLPYPVFPQMPIDLMSLQCGAKTKAGTPCKQKGIFSNGRCKLHGGLSTGPTTEEGKRKVALNGWKKKQSP